MVERPRYSGIFERIGREHGWAQSPVSDRYRELIAREQLPFLDGPVAPRARGLASPREARSWAMGLAFDLGADLAATTRVREEWTFQGREVRGRWAVMLATRMDHGAIMSAPSLRAGAEATRAYYALGDVAVNLARAMRAAGHPAVAQHPRYTEGNWSGMLFVPHAVAAGMGRLGRSGLLLTDVYGPCVRLAAVTTELELAPDGPEDPDLHPTCMLCVLCREACGNRAIPEQRTLVRGVRKCQLDADACAPLFARWDGCGACIAACPLMQLYPEELRAVRPRTPAPADGGDAPVP
jgi:ferredoxin